MTPRRQRIGQLRIAIAHALCQRPLPEPLLPRDYRLQ